MINITGSLVFDSWFEPNPDMRSGALQDRHLIYEGGGIILDLSLKRAGNGSCLHVVGQVLPTEHTLDSVSDVPVVMEQGKHRAFTHTNALGEFSFHSVPNGTFDLAIVLENRRFNVHGLARQEPRMWRVDQSEAAGVLR